MALIRDQPTSKRQVDPSPQQRNKRQHTSGDPQMGAHLFFDLPFMPNQPNPVGTTEFLPKSKMRWFPVPANGCDLRC